MSDPITPSADPPASPLVVDYRRAPLGVMPRQLQRWLLVGISVVMVGIMALSGSPMKPRSASTTPSATAVAVDANQQRIEEYQRRIQEQTQRLAAEQAALQAVKEAAAPAPDVRAATARLSSTPPVAAERSTTPDSTRQERVQRDYRSLFADNVAFSRERQTTHVAVTPTGPTNPPTMSAPPDLAVPAPALPMAAVGGPVATAPVAPPMASTAPTRPAGRPSGGPPASDEPTYRISEGTIIETVLTNRLDGTYAGPVNCLVTTAVYAPDLQHVLIPAGARVLGEARPVTSFGQSRLAVVFHRVLLPNGHRVDLEAFHGLNQIGETGLRDQVDHHYAQIFGASLAVGAIAGLAQARTSVGLDATALDVYRQGAATNLAQSSARILDRFLNLLPTVTILEGHRIKVYLSNDLELPAYRDQPASLTPKSGGHS
jgi:type IV secretory pathway VirB10-like protein